MARKTVRHKITSPELIEQNSGTQSPSSTKWGGVSTVILIKFANLYKKKCFGLKATALSV